MTGLLASLWGNLGLIFRASFRRRTKVDRNDFPKTWIPSGILEGFQYHHHHQGGIPFPGGNWSVQVDEICPESLAIWWLSWVFTTQLPVATPRSCFQHPSVFLRGNIRDSYRIATPWKKYVDPKYDGFGKEKDLKMPSQKVRHNIASESGVRTPSQGSFFQLWWLFGIHPLVFWIVLHPKDG